MNPFTRIPALVLVMVAIVSVQAGAGFAKQLFGVLSPQGVVFLRVLFASIMLLVFARPAWRALTGAHWRVVLLFAAVLGGMNAFYYAALERMPLGLAVTIEFIGPLGVALWQSHRVLDWCWGALAALGVALLNPFAGAVDPIGFTLALFAGGCWGAYILLGQRLGNVLPGTQGLALAMSCAALMLMPVGAQASAPAWLSLPLLLTAIGVAFLSSALPYSLEIEAMRRIPTKVFGILMSMEPGVAALIGFLLLGEILTLTQCIAVLAVMAASLGATYFARHDTKPA